MHCGYGIDAYELSIYMLIIVAYKILLLQVLLPEGSKICSKTSSGGPYLLTNLVPGVVQICQGGANFVVK